MGRLTLNVLLSFAQFEREVTAERVSHFAPYELTCLRRVYAARPMR
jgi:hypothetical protein